MNLVYVLLGALFHYLLIKIWLAHTEQAVLPTESTVPRAAQSFHSVFFKGKGLLFIAVFELLEYSRQYQSAVGISITLSVCLVMHNDTLTKLVKLLFFFPTSRKLGILIIYQCKN